jgi:hypothetical protein
MLLRHYDFVIEHLYLGSRAVDQRYPPFQRTLRQSHSTEIVPAIMRGVQPALSCAFTSTPGILKTALAFSKSPKAQTQCRTLRSS